MELLMNYMYRGEINVEENELMGLLATAKSLQIKGVYIKMTVMTQFGPHKLLKIFLGLKAIFYKVFFGNKVHFYKNILT